MAVTHDVCVSTGEYEVEGQKKRRWMKIGVLFDSEKGKSIKLDALPIANIQGEVWLSLFPKKERAAPLQVFRDNPNPF